MNNPSSLQAIVAEARTSGRISFAHVQHLRRDVLADGSGSRAEAELLLGLDRSLAKRDPAWERFLVAAVVDFVVWAERPTGTVDEGTARWLQTLLDGSTSSRTARLIAREVARRLSSSSRRPPLSQRSGEAAHPIVGRVPSRPRPCRRRRPPRAQRSAGRLPDPPCAARDLDRPPWPLGKERSPRRVGLWQPSSTLATCAFLRYSLKAKRARKADLSAAAREGVGSGPAAPAWRRGCEVR
jgi:hypothetical protein